MCMPEPPVIPNIDVSVLAAAEGKDGFRKHLDGLELPGAPTAHPRLSVGFVGLSAVLSIMGVVNPLTVFNALPPTMVTLQTLGALIQSAHIREADPTQSTEKADPEKWPKRVQREVDFYWAGPAKFDDVKAVEEKIEFFESPKTQFLATILSMAQRETAIEIIQRLRTEAPAFPYERIKSVKDAFGRIVW